MVHAVGDSANLKQYLPTFGKFLHWTDGKQADLSSIPQVDRAMADWCAELCYVENKHPYHGRNALAAYNHLYPENSGSLEVVARAVKLSRKLRSKRERKPIPLEVLYATSFGEGLLGWSSIWLTAGTI